MSASVVILVVSEVFFSSTSEVPSGRVSVSILIVKLLPRLSTDVPGRVTSKTPCASLVPSPTTSPDSSSTVTSTSGTGDGGLSRLSVRQPIMWMESPSLGGGFAQVSPSASGAIAALATLADPTSATAARTIAATQRSESR